MIVPFKLQTGLFIYIDLNTRLRVFENLQYDFIYPFQEGFSIVRHKNTYGVVNLKGELIIPLIYNSIINFSEGHFLAVLNNKYGIIDTEGKIVIPPIYNNLSKVKDGLILFAEEEEEEDLYKEIAVNANIKYGYINLRNEIVILPQFTPAEDFSEELAVVGKIAGMDDDYNEIIKYGYINTKGNITIDYQFDSANSFSKGLANVTKDSESYFIDKKGNKVHEVNEIENQYPITFKHQQLVKDIFNNIAVIETFGYKDNGGKTVINPIYTDAADFENGLALVSINSNIFYILPSGEELCQRNIF